MRASSASVMSLEAFLRWTEGDHLWFEWHGDRISRIPPCHLQETELLNFLLLLFSAYLSERPIGQCLTAPFAMHLPQIPSARSPDLLFLLDEHAGRLKETYLDGPADVVVEIVSEESQDRDRGVKFVEYEAAGVTEYWLIDPLREHADFYRLGDDGRYDRIALDAEGRFHSAVLPDLGIKPDWLWRDPLPTLADALRWVGEMLQSSAP